MAKKQPYSTRYTARGNPRRYLLSGIPPSLWERVRAKARRDHVAVRQVILSLLDAWARDSFVPAGEIRISEGDPDKAA
jgi:hypothetical protein